MSTVKNCINQRFDRLVVIGKAGVDKGRHVLWECKCDCGNTIAVTGNNLRSGNTKSCGCMARESLTNRNTKHGESKTRLYRIWSGIHTRCKNCNRSDSKSYALRGITVCDEWGSYEGFKKWAMSNGYNNMLSIDRIDNDKGYSPENCRRVTQKQQCNNRRSNIIVEYRGEKITLAEYADIVGLPYQTVYRSWTRGGSLECL